MNNNDLDFELAKSVGAYFRLVETKMNLIIKEVIAYVKSWEALALEIGISSVEQTLLKAAFKIGE